ncbi:hypothetical protein ACH5RR_025376 [Cinchona calisaya]|uniref:ARM repeat superfamily protein n=1 Tax=Cinchona calisaya TaxID=153742 RepID=A0ABD2Z0J8_9GENT
MEKVPAACAMEWSIELEKGLRSKNPGKRIEAISKIGQRLEWWNRESRITVSQYKIFGLIPGEDKLFANAILLRLADMFRVGDRQTKTSIVKIFMQELKSRRKRRSVSVGGEEEGILSKNVLVNYLEILRRVKVVFDEGDVEERALALYLFGCWAEFAVDSADIRYVILSAIVSDNVLEVKASLFAARCFCELANDFASVLLEILANRLTSSETSTVFKLEGGRAFADMWRSFPLANRAYKTGLKLVLDSSEESFSTAMLISLTKLASRWTLLIPQQVELLFSFLAKYRAMHMQVKTLKCLKFLFARGVCPCPETRDMIQNLLDIQNQSKFPPALQHEVLKVLHKIISYNLPTFPSSEMLEVFSIVLKFVENIIQSSIMSERFLAIWVLIDILSKFLGRPKLESDEMASTLAFQLVSLVMDHISVPMKSNVGRHLSTVNTGDLRTTMTCPLDRHQSTEELKREVTSLLKPILYLVENHSDVSGLVLDKVSRFLENLVNMLHRGVSTKKEDLLKSEILKCGKEDKTSDILKLGVFLAKIIITCLENIEVENAKTVEVLNSLKLLVDYVCKSISFDSCIYGIYMLLLHFHGAYKCVWQEMNQIIDPDDNYTLPCGASFLQHDTLISECAKKIFERRDNWSSYKAGKHAACQGLWSTATFLFEQLKKMVISDSSSLWLKTLILFSHSECQIQYFGIINAKETLSEVEEDIAQKNNLCKYAETLVRAYNGVCLAEKTLRTSALGLAFNFQRWFLVLRAKVLKIMVDITALLGPVSFVQESSSSGKKRISFPVPSLIPLERDSLLVDSLTLISLRLKKLTDEFDLFAASFIGMDRRSMRIISSLATSCSLLAFVTGLALPFPRSHVSSNNVTCSLDSSEEKFHAVLIQDLLERLWLIDSDTSKGLWMLLKVNRHSKSCFLPKSQGTSISYRSSGIVKLCKYAIMEILDRQKEASTFSSDESRSQISNDGLQLLLHVVWKWMQIPFKCPKHFFQVRHNVLSELFAMNEYGENVDGTAVSLGSHLSLNLCLQLKNMPPSLPLRLSKLYCILSCTIHPQNEENKEQAWLNSEEWEVNDILDLNEKLVRYVTGSSTPCGIHIKNNAGSCWTKDQYVCFHPNDRGQGFSTCLLDISDFPVGNYRIKWHSCWIDNEGSYGSLLPLNAGPNFNIEKPSTSRSTRIEVP